MRALVGVLSWFVPPADTIVSLPALVPEETLSVPGLRRYMALPTGVTLPLVIVPVTATCLDVALLLVTVIVPERVLIPAEAAMRVWMVVVATVPAAKSEALKVAAHGSPRPSEVVSSPAGVDGTLLPGREMPA